MSGGLVVRVVDGPSAGLTVPIEGPVVVGREGDLVIADRAVSRRHARLEPEGSTVKVVDLGSSGGTRVNGTPTSSAELVPGDRVRIGHSELVVLRLQRFADVDGSYVLVETGERHKVAHLGDGITMGRDPTNDVCIDHPAVSRFHARISSTPSGAVVEDLGSSNGMQVDGRPVERPVVLRDRAEILLGGPDVKVTFHEGSEGAGVVVSLVVEGDIERSMVSVDADSAATVAQVTAELVLTLDLDDESWLLYRPGDGALLHPDDRWCSTGITSGERICLGKGDASALPVRGRARLARPRGHSLNQLPRTVWPVAAHNVERIDAPDSTSFKGRGILWQVVGGIGSVLVGLLLVVVRPEYWAFGLITGAIGIISISVSVLGEQSRRRHKVAEFRKRLIRLDQELSAALGREADVRRSLSPDNAELERRITEASSRIWERRPSDADALRLRLGTGEVHALVDVEAGRTSDSPLQSELDAVIDRHRSLGGVPIQGPGPASGSLGLVGEPQRVRDLAARMLVEAAAMHPPEQLRIWVAADDPSWSWCRWLPHVGEKAVSEGPQQVSEVLAEAALAIGGSRDHDVLDLVLVTDTSARADLAALLSMGGARSLVVVAGRHRRDLPGGLQVVLDIAAHGRATTIGSYPGSARGDILVDGLDDQVAEDLAMTLARLGGRAERRGSGGIVELLGLGSPTTVDVRASWSDPPVQPLTVAVGTDDSGAPVSIGMRRDGPHGMVAGTTGSGKSELLQTMLAALALRHGPDRLNLFLIDFKGGSTFAPLLPLPHVVGVVTDIEGDSSLAARAFTAIDAEIDRRKRILDSARVADVAGLERSGDRSLPDLLIVIDELALLVDRHPEVKDRLDTVAAQGRSLGMHLLLATQTPSGVITQAIRSNTNLWLCLRVVTESESLEILGSRDAARIEDSSPGRAVLRRGASEDLRAFQAARVARPVGEDDAVRVTVRGARAGTRRAAASSTTELDLIVARVVEAARGVGFASARPLWLPPLPLVLRSGEVEKVATDPERLGVVVGLADDPRRAAQDPFVVDLSGSGHLLVTGLLGSGKSSTLTQVGADLARRRSPSEVHLYGLDTGTGGLRSLKVLPHVGDVVAGHDVERVTRLVDRLMGEIAERRDLMAADSAGSFLEWRRGGGGRPWLVLLLDDYPAFKEVAEQVDSGRLLERFGQVLHGGPAVGVHVVIATPQPSDLRTRELNLIPTRVMLRSADPGDHTLVDVRAGTFPTGDMPPGRGFTNGALEVQVCLVDPSAIEAVVGRWAGADRSTLPPEVRRLPRRLERADLVRVARGDAFAVGGSEVEPISVSLPGAPPTLLVAGPNQSGRSTALLGLLEAERSVRGHDVPVLVVAPRRGPLDQLRDGGDVRVVSRLEELADALDAFDAHAASGGSLIVDDAEALAGMGAVSDRLDRFVRQAGDRNRSVFVATRTSDLPGLFEPWVRYLVSLRRAVLLQPTADDAFVFGARLPAIPTPVAPGRGVLVQGPAVSVVQVAEATVGTEGPGSTNPEAGLQQVPSAGAEPGSGDRSGTGALGSGGHGRSEGVEG